MHRDGANFGPVQGARREPCRCIVTDEQRSNGPKVARPGGVVMGSPPDSVASLARATSPHCAPLLAGELPMTITMYQSNLIRL